MTWRTGISGAWLNCCPRLCRSDRSRIQAQQLSHSLGKRRRRLTARQPSPLHKQELFRYPRVGVVGLVNYYRYQEGRVIRDVQKSPRGEFPLTPEIPFGPRIGMR